MKNISKFIGQSNFHMYYMEKSLYGDESMENSGLIDLKKAAIDVYNEMQDYCSKKALDINTSSAFGKYLAEKHLTREDVDGLFILKNVPETISNQLLIRGYDVLARAIKTLSAKKRQKFFGAKSAAAGAIKDLAAWLDTYDFINKMFLDYLGDQRDMMMTLELDSNGAKYRPTKEEIIKISAIDKKVNKMTQDYNEQVIDNENGAIAVYDSVVDCLNSFAKMGVINSSVSRAEFDNVKFPPVHVDMSKVNPEFIPQ